MTITEFLLARITEDESHVEFIRDFIPDEGNQGEYIDPARVLAECEVKRHLLDESLVWGEGCASVIAQYMAEVYADHPDYREEWRP